ncbi:MAG: bifunctional (p)ppGpp synthetase/guanosine-3',5'-bis(diphosphate) 3'-pyrophosphohydrolase [Acidobacteriota bacterium]|nr:bifunctional (p)ppGpp synthetase/guanosine-3',5'-bis(diphosphate) 3'-pyrophosphohydrolase [Acidobacteriota bacterium]
MIRFETIRDRVRAYQPDADFDLLRAAYVIAAQAHQGQVRLSGEPYLNHPLEVAGILADLKLDIVSVACGLLHDVVEDTKVTNEDLERRFGRDVSRVIDGLTKLSRVEFSSAEANQAENVRKMIIAMTDDTRVILIKLADRLHNMRTLDFLREEKRQRIATETLDVYAPIAGRLGIGRIEAELQDLALRHLEPQTYKVLEARVKAKKRWAEDFIRDLSRTLKRELQAEEIPGELSGRTKSIYSIYRKMHRQQIELDQMYDFIALRLVTDTVPHCYTALGVIHNVWKPIPGRIKDFIAMPRVNGYQSLHTSLMTESGTHFEVQIRTTDMHRVAEEGIAAHWSYKSSGSYGEQDIKRFAWLRQVLEWQKEVKDPHEFLSSLKIDLYPDEVHCFTPRGEVKSLPRGATPIDFAYAIHTEVGHGCIGARVNGAMAPLRYELRNGDICEILTRKNHLPSEDWLKIARTNRAKSKIRARLNAEAKRESIEIGRKLLEKEARSHGLSLRRVRSAPGLADAMKRHGAPNLDDLFAAIGYGKVSAARALADAVPADQLKRAPEKEPPSETGFAGAVRRFIGRDPGQILVSGQNDILVHRARCCSPLPGEAIAGYITKGKGVAVHAAKCRHLADLARDPERQVDVSWKSTTGTRYDAGFLVRVENRKGMLADITKIIAEADTDIRAFEGAADDAERGDIYVTVAVENAKEVGAISRLLQTVPGVIEVQRGSPAR